MSQCTKLRSMPSTIRYQCLLEPGHDVDCKFSEVVPVIDEEVLQQRDQYLAQVEKLIEENRKLQDAVDRDKSGLAGALGAVLKEVEGRRWVVQGRGSYEWNDDKYRQETGWALEAIEKIATDALAASAKLAHETLKGL